MTLFLFLRNRFYCFLAMRCMRSWSAHAEAPAFFGTNLTNTPRIARIRSVFVPFVNDLHIFVLQKLVFVLVLFYQKTISPDHGLFVHSYCRCRFFPSCSAYSRGAISRYGFLYGIAISLVRIIRCGPWSAGGYDPAGEIQNSKPQVPNKFQQLKS